MSPYYQGSCISHMITTTKINLGINYCNYTNASWTNSLIIKILYLLSFGIFINWGCNNLRSNSHTDIAGQQWMIQMHFCHVHPLGRKSCSPGFSARWFMRRSRFPQESAGVFKQQPSNVFPRNPCPHCTNNSLPRDLSTELPQVTAWQMKIKQHLCSLSVPACRL